MSSSASDASPTHGNPEPERADTVTAPSGPSKRVQLVLPDVQGGGAERTSVNVQRQLAGGPIDIQIVLMDARGEYLESLDPRDWMLPPGAWLRGLAQRCKPDSPQRAVLQVPPLMSLLLRTRPDVIMTSMADVTAPMAVAMALLPRRFRPFWIAREGNNAQAVVEEAYPEPGPRRWIQRILAWSYASADVVLVPSRGIGDCLETFYGIPKSRIQVIGNPTDIARVRGHAAEAPDIDLPERFIVGVGRLAPQKGFDVLIRAFSKLEDTGLSLVICGVGPERDALERLADELGVADRVILAGFQNNPWAVMARAQAFCLSSRWEGFGHVVVEAMACETPVVVTECDYGPGEIVRAGIDGWVVPVDDHQAMAAALNEVLSDESDARMRVVRARARAESFDLARIAAAYGRLFTTGRADADQEATSAGHLEDH